MSFHVIFRCIFGSFSFPLSDVSFRDLVVRYRYVVWFLYACSVLSVCITYDIYA